MLVFSFCYYIILLGIEGSSLAFPDQKLSYGHPETLPITYYGHSKKNSTFRNRHRKIWFFKPEKIALYIFLSCKLKDKV